MSTIVGPRNFHERNGLFLPQCESRVQTKLNELSDYVSLNQMEINSSKTKIQPFNFSRRYDFVPELEIGGEQLEVVYSSRLLGVQRTSDCRWNDHVANLIQKANVKMWYLRRLKNLGASESTLKEVYVLFIRQTLEFVAPLWTSSLSKQNIDSLEKFQHHSSN